jgi:lipopolysaccharide export system protein LptA
MTLAGEAAVVPAPKKSLALSMLPNGSELKDVIAPRYDEHRKLVGVLKAKTLILVNESQIAAETISIEMFNPDLSPRGRIDLVKATFDQKKNLLIAKEPTKIISDRMVTRGNGLYYAFARGEGFIPGPATTIILATPETTMHPLQSPLRATALLGMSLLSQPLNAAAPQVLSPAEIAAIQADAAPKAADAKAAVTAAHEGLDKDLSDGAAASQAAAKFLVESDQPAVAADTIPAPTQPLDVQPGPTDSVIHCEGGMYFDADAGVLVYLKNVTVKNPRFNLSGANELKIFLGPKAAKKGETKPAANGKPDKSRFGDVERMIATGAVKIEQKAPDAGKPPINASGAVFTYNVKKEEIVLSGGYPWVTQGATYMRAKEPNLILRIFPKTGSFVTEGNWDMGGNLEQKN